MTELVFKTEDNQLRVCSMTIAQMFGVKHRHLKGIIREIINTLENPEDVFFEGYLANETGRKIPVYIMDRNGFELLAMCIPGEKTLHAKMSFITAFNAMADSLVNENRIHEIEMLLQLIDVIEKNNKRISHLEKRVDAIELEM